MDMRKYAGSSFLKVEDVRDSTRQDQIVDEASSTSRFCTSHPATSFR